MSAGLSLRGNPTTGEQVSGGTGSLQPQELSQVTKEALSPAGLQSKDLLRASLPWEVP